MAFLSYTDAGQGLDRSHHSRGGAVTKELLLAGHKHCVFEHLAWLLDLGAGQEGTIAAPAEAAQSTKNTSDLLRRWKEYATSFKDNLKSEPAPMSDAEVGLRNEKIKIDDFQDKVMTASRKVQCPAFMCLMLFWG